MLSIQKNMDGTYTINMVIEQNGSQIMKFGGVFKRVDSEEIPEPDPSFFLNVYLAGENPGDDK